MSVSRSMSDNNRDKLKKVTETENESSYREIDPKRLYSNIPSPYPNNLISTSGYTFLTIIPKTLYEQYHNISYFWFTLIIFLDFYLDIKEFSLKWYNLITLTLILFASLYQNVVQTINRIHSDKKINTKKVKLWKPYEFKDVETKNLQVGDVIFIQQYEEFPSDTLLISSSEFSQISVSANLNICKSQKLVKKPFENFIFSRSTDQTDLLNYLSKFEKLSVLSPNKSFTKFKARVRFYGDPKNHYADISNFVTRGCKLLSSEPVYGIVVYTGMETKVWINSKADNKEKLPKLGVIINIVHSIHFFIIIGFVSVSVSLAASNPGLSLEYSISESIMWHILMYGNLISISLFVAIKVARIVSAVIIRLKTKNIQIDPMIIEELGKVEYVIAEKDEVLNEEKLKLTTFVVGNQVFYKQVKHVNGTRAEKYEILKPSHTFKSIPAEFCLFETLKKEMGLSEISDEFFHYFIAAGFLSFRFAGVKGSREDKEIIKKIGKLGISISEISDFSANFRINDLEFRYDIIGKVEDEHSKTMFIQNKSADSHLIISKCDVVSMQDTIEGELYINSFNQEFFTGFKAFFFKVQELSSSEAETLASSLKAANRSALNQEKKIQQIFESFDENMKILGFLGLEYLNLKETKKTIKNLNKSGIKTWLVAGDSYSNSILAAYSTGFFYKSSKTRSISGLSDESSSLETLEKILREETNNYREEPNTIINFNTSFNQSRSKTRKITNIGKIYNEHLSYSFKRANRTGSLNQVNQSFSQNSSFKLETLKSSTFSHFNLMIDGQSLTTIQSSPAALKLFVITLFISQSVCFYSLTPDQKKDIVSILRQNFSFKPTILALGDSHSDSGMLDQASISVIINRERKEEIYFYPNVFIPCFSKLSELILVHGHYSYVRISKIFHYTMYKEIMICILFFLYQFNSGFSGASIIDFELLVIFELFISLFPLIIIGVFEKDVKEKIARKSALVYSVGFLNELTSNKKLAFYSFIGFFQGIIIYVFVIYGFGDVVNEKGFTEDSDVRGTLCFIVICMSILQKVFVTTRNFYFPTLVSPILTIFFIAIIVVLTYYERVSFYSNSNEIITNQSCFWVLVLTLPSFFTGGYFIFSSFYFKLIEPRYRTRYEMFEGCLDKVFKQGKESKMDKGREGLEINKKLLRFKSDYQELKYQEYLSKSYYIRLRFVSCFISIFMFSYLGFLYSGLISDLQYKNYAIFPAIISLSFTIATFKKNINGEKLTFAIFLFILIIFIINTILNNSFTITRYPIIEVLFSVSLNFRWRTTVTQIILSFTVSLLLSLLEYMRLSQSLSFITFLFCTTLNLGISSLCIIITYAIDLSKRKEYIFVQKTRKQFEKSNEILSYLLPNFVKKRVNDGVRYIAEEKGVVSVIFCDICEFDKIIEDYSQSELFALLDDLYSRFDKICESAGVSKIETVGKTYLACAGLKDFDSDLNSCINEICHARRAIEMAFAVLQESSKTLLKSGEYLKMKIGIHSGPVVAGVVGFHKPQFSLVGDTVNTASRMASTLDRYDKVQISMQTYKLLEGNVDGLSFENNYPEVKGKGKMRTLIVEPGQSTIEDLQVYTEFSETSNTSSNLKSFPHSVQSKKIVEQSTNNDLLKSFNASLTWKQKLIQILCVETEAEKEFQSIIYKNSYIIQKFGLLVSGSLNIILIIISSVQFTYNLPYYSASHLGYLVIEESVTIIFLIFIEKLYRSRVFAYLLNTLYWTEMVLFLILQFFNETDKSTELLFFYFRYLLLNFCTGLFFLRSTISNISLIIVLLIKLLYFSPSEETYFFSLFFILIVLHTTYTRESNLRKDYIIRYLLQQEHSKTEQLLTQMLPYKALKNLKEEVTSFDKLNSVTIMYADIVGFTNWSSTRSPAEVIGMLSEMFTLFDKMCVKFGLYKVYTIGDCYVSMGYFDDGIKRNPANEAAQMARFAFSLIELISQVNNKIGAQLNMRIGIHIGNAIGGINGTNIIRYDIYGKDVVIANKMESNGIPGKVTVSENLKEILEGYTENEFQFEFLKDVKAWDEIVKVYVMDKK